MTSTAAFTLSAFGDEIAPDLHEQLRVLRDLRIGFLDLRGAWGKNVLRFADDEVDEARRLCGESGISVACIGSPVGKSPISQPLDVELGNLTRLFTIAAALGTDRIRIFSFYPPDTRTNTGYDAYAPEAAARLNALAALATREGFTLLLENEKEIVGDTLARCQKLMAAAGSANLRFLWDPANFVQVGEARPTTSGWPLLGASVGYVHIKDALLAGGAVVPAGEGDGQVPELLAQLREAGYHGYLSLEPHLAIAGRSSGYSGADGMARAVTALRAAMARARCIEVTVAPQA
jgi:sugar phosphate isomerase/epimerase